MDPNKNPDNAPGSPLPPQPAAPGYTPSTNALPPVDAPAHMPASQPIAAPTPDVAVTPPTPTPSPGAMGVPPASPKNNMPILIVLIVAAVLAASVATYFIFFAGGGKKSANTESKKSSQAAAGVDMSTLQSATLNGPATIAGYNERDTGFSKIKDYIADDGNCEFTVGTLNATQLPGADLDAIIEPQLKKLRDAGATVIGPNQGTALNLKDSASSKTYKMPTLTFEFSQGAKHAAVYYSAVILTGGDRAVVNRTCINANGAVDTARLHQLDNIAKQVTVTVAAQTP